MKPGSLVVIKKFRLREDLKGFIKWLPLDDEKSIYTIRDILINPNNVAYATFEEGVIGFESGIELGIGLNKLVEVQPPMNISEELFESLNEKLEQSA